MKRILTLTLLVVVAFTAIGVPSHPAAAQSTSSPATFLPADTAFYAEINTGKLTDVLNMFVGILNKAGVPVTAAQAFAGIDQQLTQALGHKVSFQTDVQSWLGDRAGVGIEVTPQMLQGASGETPVLAVLNVKDDTAADKFLGDVLNAIQKQGVTFTKTTAQVSGQTATVYSNAFLKVSLVRWPGELAIGTTAAVNNMLDLVKNSKPTLAADPKFQKTMALLSSDSDVSFFLSPSVIKAGIVAYMATTARIYGNISGNLTGTPQPTPTVASNMMQSLAMLDAYNGIAMDFRAANKTLALDIVESVDPSKLTPLFSQYGLSASDLVPTPLSGKLAGQVPSKASFFVSIANLAHLYQVFRKAIGALSTLPGITARQKQQFEQAQRGLAQFEQGLKSFANIDIDQDVLSWLGGDFGVYAVIDPNSDLSAMMKQPFPLDLVLIASASDAAKAQSFVDKLNTALQKTGNTPAAAGTGLYTVAISNPKGTVKLGYGVSNGAFLLTTAGALASASAATGGTDTLSTGSTPWKNATANLPSNVTGLEFLDLAQIGTFVQGMAAGNPSSANDQQSRIALGLLNQFESLLFYGASATDASSGVFTLQFNLK